MKRIFTRSCYIIIALFVLTSEGCMLFVPSAQKQYVSAITKQPFDVIIVPGIPYNGVSMDSTMKARVFWSYFLYKKGIAKNVIYSGAAVYTPYVESKIMALYGIALGINKKHIFTETTAQHSVENLYYSCKLAQKMGFKSIALATVPIQSALLSSFAKKHTPGVTFIPIIFDSLKAINMIKVYIQSDQAFVPNLIPLPDKSSFWERYKGTRGKHIVFEKN